MPIESSRRPCSLGELAQARGSTAGTPPGRRASGGIVIRPRTSRVGARNAPSSSGGTPDFVGLAGEVDLDERGDRRAAAPRTRESSEWTSSHIAFTTFALRLWRWPMKCQRKVSPYTACFASRSCARFSPTTSTPAWASTPMSSTDTYFVAATTVTSGPTSARIARTARGSSHGRRRSSPGGRSGRVAAVREEELRVAAGAEIRALDVLDAGGAKRPLGGASSRSSRPSRTTSSPKPSRNVPRPPPRPRSSTARSRGRSQRRARRRARATPSGRSRRAGRASRRGGRRRPDASPFARTSATGRQSAAKASIGPPGSSDQRPSPGSPSFPARRTRRRAPACRSAGALASVPTSAAGAGGSPGRARGRPRSAGRG